MDESLQPTAVGRTACGGKLKDTGGYPSALYGDERIYFCHQACLRVFEQSPDAFMVGQIEHPKKES
jgi:YHS domain-containing protein